MKKILSIIFAVLILTSSFNLSIIAANAAAPNVIVEKTTSMPSKVKVNSFSDFKIKLATAVNLKKNSITIETSKYNSKEYNSNNIKKYFNDINFEVCISKGYSAAYTVTWKTSGNSAKYTYKFTYSDISKAIRTTTLQKVRSVTELDKVIKAAILKKTSVLSIALGYTSTQKYNIENSVSRANDDEIISKGYYAAYNGCDSLSYSDSKVVNIYLDYFDSDTGIPSKTTISSYDEFYNTVREMLLDKQWKLSFSIENYNSEIYNLGELLSNFNKNISSKNGYVARVTYRTLKESAAPDTPAILEVHFEYDKTKPGDYTLEEDMELPILKNEKEWYQAVKNAITENKKSMAYNITYSSDCGNIITTVLDQNPEINYLKSYSTSSDGQILFNYKFDDDRISEMKAQVSEKAEQIISTLIKPEMNQAQRSKAIHDYLVLNTTYDYENFKMNTIPEESYTAYGILINKSGVCQGYAGAFKLLANLAGIKCIGVSGEAGQPHAWNMAELDGTVAYIDVTWDDPVPDRGSVYYEYFNISESKMGLDHTWDKKSFNEKYLNY